MGRLAYVLSGRVSIMAKLKPVGSCCCCDCYVKHNVVGCTKCLPELLCVKVEFTGGVECCQFASANSFYLCREDGYQSVNLTCGEVTLAISFDLHIVDDECCFTMNVVLDEDSVSFSKCGDNFEVGFTNQAFSLFTDDYPPVEVTGLLTVSTRSGISNNGQRGDLSLGEPPPCSLIKMNPRSEPPDLPIEDCQRPELSVASETATRTFGENFATQVANGDLESDEFCWYLSPCQCIPDEVCLTYTAYNVCDGYSTRRYKLTLTDCVYGPEVFEVDRGDPYGADEVTVTGVLTNQCEIIWRVESDAGTFETTLALTRIELNGGPPRNYVKRCDVTLGDTEVPDTDTYIEGLLDVLSISEDCLCLDPPDSLCPGACFAAKVPPVTGFTQCIPPTLYAEIISDCASEIYEMGPSTWGYSVSASVIPSDFGYPLNCQNWIAYRYYGPGNSITNLLLGSCLNTTRTFEFDTLGIFYITPDCGEDPPDESLPGNYYIYGRFVSFEGQWDFVHPVTTASCNPFQLDFVIPAPGNMSDICYCSENITIRVTL